MYDRSRRTHRSTKFVSIIFEIKLKKRYIIKLSEKVMLLTWYFYERSTLITNRYNCWQVPSFKPLLSQFEPNPLISLQVIVSESNQPPNFLERWKKVNFVWRLNTTFCVEKTLSETKAKLDKYYSDSAPPYRMVPVCSDLIPTQSQRHKHLFVWSSPRNLWSWKCHRCWPLATVALAVHEADLIQISIIEH